MPGDEKTAKKICAQVVNFAVLGDILYFIDSKHQGRKRAPIPLHLQEQILMECNGGVMLAIFQGIRSLSQSVPNGGGRSCVMMQ